MIIDVLYRAGDKKRHGWRVKVRTDAPCYIVDAWGSPEQCGLTMDRAITEANFYYRSMGNATAPCSRIIVIGWARDMVHRKINVGTCQHEGACRKLTQPAKLKAA